MLRILVLVLMILVATQGTKVKEILDKPTIVASTNGIAFKTHPAVCLRSISWTFQPDFEYFSYLSPLTEGLFKLRHTFGRYGSAQDTPSSINIRICAAAVKLNGIFPLTAVKQIKEDLARDMNMLVGMILDCERKINYLLKIFLDEFPHNEYLTLLKNAASSQIVAQLPANQCFPTDNFLLLQEQSVFLPVHENHKPTVWDKVFLTFQKLGEDFWFPDNVEAINFTSTVQDLIHDAQIAITYANTHLDELHHIIQDLKMHQFLLTLVEESSLQSTIESICTRYDSLLHTEDADFSFLIQKPLTHAIQDF